MKNKYLFYWHEGYDAWVPASIKTENIIDVEYMDPQDEEEIRFKCFEMTEEEFNNLPES